jgi:hypothetical protein
LTSARPDARPAQVVGQQRRVEVLERPQADDADLAGRGAGRHRLRHERRRLQRAHRRRQQQVLLEAAHVRIGLHHVLPPRDRRGQPVATDERVRMVGTQLRHRLGRSLDPVRRVAEHVDRARAQVRRPHALGQHEHARAALGEPHRGRQAGQPGPSDDDVVVAHPGTCSTSSRPWKIQSSSRAWRSWSP